MNTDYKNHDENASSQTATKSAVPVVYIANIPFNMTKEGLAALFKLKIGGVVKVYIFTKFKLSIGRGLIEFVTDAYAQKAIRRMNMYYVFGQHLIVKRDNGKGIYWLNKHFNKCYTVEEVRESQDNDSVVQSRDYIDTHRTPYNMIPTYNMSSLAVNKIFVGNLNYKVEKNKLMEVFSLAGEVLEIEMIMQNNGKNRGFAKVTYSHPLEAVQAISMFHDQFLYGRSMIVRFNNSISEMPIIPNGLEGIGDGLGPGGAILNIKDCLPKKYFLPPATIDIFDSEINATKPGQFSFKTKENYSLPPATIDILDSEINATKPEQLSFKTEEEGFKGDNNIQENENIIDSNDLAAGVSSLNLL